MWSMTITPASAITFSQWKLDSEDGDLIAAYLARCGNGPKPGNWLVTAHGAHERHVGWATTQFEARGLIAQDVTRSISIDLHCWRTTGWPTGIVREWCEDICTVTVRELVAALPELPVTVFDYVDRWYRRGIDGGEHSWYDVTASTSYCITDHGVSLAE